MADPDAPPAAAVPSPEMIAAITAAVIAGMRAQPAPEPAPPVVPPYTGSGGTSEFGGKSLPSLFPTLDGKTVTEVATHSLSPLDLPRLLSPLASRHDPAAPPPSSSAAEHTLALKHYPTFQSLLRPLLKYFEILSAFAASSGKPWEVFAITRAQSAHLTHLSEMQQHYKWSAVVIYHVEFHMLRLLEMKHGVYTGWCSPNLDLLARVVYPHPLPAPSSTSSTSSSSSASSSTSKGSAKSKRVPIEQQICFDFNSGSCKSSPCPNKRRHVCRSCEGDHPGNACPTKTA